MSGYDATWKGRAVAKSLGVPRPEAMPASVAHHESMVLFKLGNWVQASIDAALQPQGLKSRHYTTLSVLRDKGPWAQHAVADKLRIDKATMVAVIQELESRGYVGRERDPADRRHYTIWVTAEGLAWFLEAETLISTIEDEVFAPLSATERRTLLKLMNALFVS
jgi:DNA-binding MarR family transcriptional regulator